MADPTRRRVLDMLLDRERSAGELGEAFPDLSQPAMSRHLKVLREVGLIRARPSAQQRIYSLSPEAFAELDAWLSRYQRFWGPRLDALAHHLNTQHPPQEAPPS